MTALREWWLGRSERERLLLMIMGALLAAVVYWFGLVAPLQAARADAERRHAAAVAELAEIEAGLNQVAALERAAGAGRLSEPLEAAVRRVAGESGVGLAAVAPAAGGVSARSEGAPPLAFFRWIALLQRRHGVGVNELVLVKNPDGSLRAQVVFAGPGA